MCGETGLDPWVLRSQEKLQNQACSHPTLLAALLCRHSVGKGRRWSLQGGLQAGGSPPAVQDDFPNHPACCK